MATVNQNNPGGQSVPSILPPVTDPATLPPYLNQNPGGGGQVPPILPPVTGDVTHATLNPGTTTTQTNGGSTEQGVSPPVLVGPIDDCMHSVTVQSLLGTRVDVYVNGMWRGTAGIPVFLPSFGGGGGGGDNGIGVRHPIDLPIIPFEVPLTGCCLKIGDLVQASETFTNAASPLSAGILVESHVKYSCLTQHYNSARTGWYPYEVQLAPDTIEPKKQPAPFDFKKQFELLVDGKPYAQPLYMHHVYFPGYGARNVVYIATENNTVYAYDADDPGIKSIKGNQYPQGVLLWKRSLLMPGERAPVTDQTRGITNVDLTCDDIAPTVGISSTPVISCGCCCSCDRPGCNCHSDADTLSSGCSSTMYVVAKSVSGPKGVVGFVPGQNSGVPNGTFHIRLHALDVVTGSERPNSPVEIKGQFDGTGGDSTNSYHKLRTNDGSGHVIFNPIVQNNRPALLLLNGIVYIGFASHCDNYSYTGWIFAYDAKTLKQTGVWCTTPSGSQAGVWQGEFGLATDGNAIYFTTGNGSFDADSGGVDYGNCVVKLSPDLRVLSFFAPADRDVLNHDDRDLGSGGVMVIPSLQIGSSHPNLMITCGKDGMVTLLDRDNLGGVAPATTRWDINTLGHYNTTATQAQYPGIPSDGAHSTKTPSNSNAVATILLRPDAARSNAIYSGTTIIGYVSNQTGVFGGPAFFSDTEQVIYYAGDGGNLTVFQLISNMLKGTSELKLTATSNLTYSGSTTPVVSSNGSQSGIVWAVNRANSDVALCAYDADNFGNEIINIPIGSWNAGGNRSFGAFIEPTVVNGKVYIANQSYVSVFFCANEYKIS